MTTVKIYSAAGQYSGSFTYQRNGSEDRIKSIRDHLYNGTSSHLPCRIAPVEKERKKRYRGLQLIILLRKGDDIVQKGRKLHIVPLQDAFFQISKDYIRVLSDRPFKISFA